uniref:Ankyrin n=1 Tax=uncultured bacterium esnapd14 TaxID=1366594 RepID=S5TMS1_9BACT|nr:ankyrin [uncultured bacterium esnapd14]
MQSERHFDLPAPPTPADLAAQANARAATEGIGIDDARQAVADEYGYPDWALLENAAAHPAEIRPISRLGTDLGMYEERARNYLSELSEGSESAERRFRRYVPRLTGVPDVQSLAERATLRDAELVVAHEAGCLTWRELVDTVQRLTSRKWSGTRWCDADGIQGELVTAVRRGDAERVRALLAAHPELVNLRDADGGTILETIVQPNGLGSKEINDPGVVQAIIDAGADLDRAVNLAAGFNRVNILDALLGAGADVTNTVEWGITPLEAALYHGSAEAAQRLAAVEVVPRAFWVAAGCNRVDLLEEFHDESGTLRPEAYRYRPNLADIGWPIGPPREDDQAAVVAEALVLACQAGATDAVRWLLDHGADVNAQPWPGLTGLHFAVSAGRGETVDLLMARGADASLKDAQHHATAVQWAEHHATAHPDSPRILRQLSGATR